MSPLVIVTWFVVLPVTLWCVAQVVRIWRDLLGEDRERWAIEARAADELAGRRAERERRATERGGDVA
jgi:hypothetical protein